MTRRDGLELELGPLATRFRIRTLAVIAAGLVAIATASPAAARLTRTTTVTTAEEPYLIVNCDGTEIRVEPEGRIATTVFRDEDGAVAQEAVVFIGYRAMLTNLGTGASITVLLSGSSISAFNPDGSSTFVRTGSWLHDGADPATGDIGLFHYHGRESSHLEPGLPGPGTTDRAGYAVDLCPALTTPVGTPPEG